MLEEIAKMFSIKERRTNLLAPMLHHGKHCGHLSTNQWWSIYYIDWDIAYPFTCLNGLLNTLWCQGYINTASKQIFLIPQGFTMPNQYKSAFTCNDTKITDLQNLLYAPNLWIPNLNVANGQFSKNKQTSNHHTSSLKWKSLKLLDFFGVWPLLPSDGSCIGSMTEDCELEAHTKPSFRLPEPQLPKRTLAVLFSNLEFFALHQWDCQDAASPWWEITPAILIQGKEKQLAAGSTCDEFWE